MWFIEYYTRRDARQPAVEWLDSLDKRHTAVINAKIQKLSEYGLELLSTEMLKTISGDDKDFYELRGGRCRIATYYDRPRNTFVLLHGWLKKKPSQKKDIEQSRRLLYEYLSV
jgi:mRNA-degrading endonuclease RelE of RelBE toxin-antitoxin system